VRFLKLALVAGGGLVLHLDWKVIAGAFLGGFAAQLVNAVNLQRVAARAVAQHEQTFHSEAPRG
jgi:hypothetical protein